jgi:hypothetical protein
VRSRLYIYKYPQPLGGSNFNANLILHKYLTFESLNGSSLPNLSISLSLSPALSLSLQYLYFYILKLNHSIIQLHECFSSGLTCP